jgi:hypothetical protein
LFLFTPTQENAQMSAELADRPDLRSLPLGLKRYRPGVFEKLHAAGNKTFTASMVPALFGESRFHGAFATMCHAAGLVPLPDFGDSELMTRGTKMEGIAVDEVREQEGWPVCHHIKAWAPHPTIAGLAASPDALAWQTPDGEPGIGEIKVVLREVFQGRDKLRPDYNWLGGPPMDVELQHQTQLACTGAKWGFIAALMPDYGWKLVVYPTEPDPRIIRIIEAKARECLAMLEAGDMGVPDEHPTSIKSAQALWAPVEGKVLALNDPEAGERLERWIQARADRLAYEKVEDAQQRWFAARALDHDKITVPGGGFVKISNRKRKAFSVPAGEFRVLEPKEAKGEDG